MEEIKNIEIKADKLELRQMAKGEVCFTLTAYELDGLNHPEDFVAKVKKLKQLVEKELNVKEII